MNIAEFHQQLERLVKGDLDPDQWISWWNHNNTRIQSLCNAGQRLRLKPIGSNDCATRATWSSQKEAQAILSKAGIDVPLSSRYEDEWRKEFEAYRQNSAEQGARTAEALSEACSKLRSFCPAFTQYLERNPEQIERLGPGAEDSEIVKLEDKLGSSLPSSVRGFFRLCSRLELDGLRLSLRDVFLHPFDDSAYFCIGEYWHEADGDQLLVSIGGSDAVYYYGHESPPPKVRLIASRLAHLLDDLPTQLQGLFNG